MRGQHAQGRGDRDDEEEDGNSDKATEWLWLEVVGARNLESRQAMDTYCVVRVLGEDVDTDEDDEEDAQTDEPTVSLDEDDEEDDEDDDDVDEQEAEDDARRSSGTTAGETRVLDGEARPTSTRKHVVVGAEGASRSKEEKAREEDLGWRSVTVSATVNPTWSLSVTLPLRRRSDMVAVEIFNEKNFFFDMFPLSAGGIGSRRAGDEHLPRCGRIGTAWDSVEIPDGDDDEADGLDPARVLRHLAIGESDEALGIAEIDLRMLRRRGTGPDLKTAAYDGWQILRCARSGEVRVRMVLWRCPNERGSWPPEREDCERIIARHLYNENDVMEDHYGFRIPQRCAPEWVHLRSYEECREQRRINEWETAFGSQFFALVKPRVASSKECAVVRRLAREGVPRHWRQRVYMAMSGAREKQEQETSVSSDSSYWRLVQQIDSSDSISFRQIELDIDRTFGHSGTKIATEAGRNTLRRVLKAYSMRNPAVGYCQGLNFIVGFLSLLVDEESVFWLLAVICEDMYPGYYIPTMADTQTDMLVLKQLIAEELPELDVFTQDVGLPLELLGSQWLLCLFTTTFPAETVFRIFDCLFSEGSHFVFAVIMAHLRRLARQLVTLEDFQTVLSTLKEAESTLLDADEFIQLATQESERITAARVAQLREEHSISVRDEMQRADRARALNRQLAIVYQIPAFSSTAASLLRFFHEEAEVSSRSDVAFLLTLLCHGLVWLAEHSKRLRR
ncbi:hypothetical protein PINS_up003572 [Pythium insidiosum]|nr:hypothetical protein PINS_up003572 [Pythium insidiosum]